MERKQYWDGNYTKYWQERTSDRNQSPLRGDCLPADVNLFQQYVDRLNISAGHRVLEVGVGFGRLVSVLLQRGARLCGIDISPQMIEEAAKKWGGAVEELREAEAEALPYADNSFEHVVCWGVFDACYQGDALAEMARVLKPGGRLLLTGKNDDYPDDDDLAYAAETNARAKGHPNYFTNLATLLDAIAANGLRVEDAYYFARRGDFGKHEFTAVPPPHFYEYALICVKDRHVVAPPSFTVARSFSRTCARRDPQLAVQEDSR